MLQSIFIKNYALIDELDIKFYPGFSVITGETGAGKSIILGAIGLLLGQRADIKAIKRCASKCTVEAKFSISSCNMEDFFHEHDLEYDPDECIIRRELFATGKSRGFINDTPVSLVQLKQIGEKLIDVHSQHQNLLINDEEFQMNVLDIISNDQDELASYSLVFKNYKSICNELNELVSNAEKCKQDEDFIRFQLQQLDDANLQDGEQISLENELETLSHAEDIKAGLYKVATMLSEDDVNLLSVAKDCKQTLNNISKVFSQASDWSERLDSCYIELKDLAREISVAQDEVEFNPERLDYINDRLNLIYSLEQKHRVNSVEEILHIKNDYEIKLNKITSFDDTIDELRNKKNILFKEVLTKAEKLTQLRTKGARVIENKMQDMLIPLGMPNVRFAVNMSQREEPDKNGTDNVVFLFSANKNGALQSVASVASGGEIARVMLSLKAMIAGAVKLPTIIFDEIDTGVSGSIAEKMAMIMSDMGNQNRQVISITHLPQIAARGTTHYKVYKEDTDDGTNSHIIELSKKERINEIANMLSGSTLTEAAVNNAKALLNIKN